MLPDGLHYVDSWVVADERLDRCFQLMETDDAPLFDTWLQSWRDLADFDVPGHLIGRGGAARRRDVGGRYYVMRSACIQSSA